MPQHDQVVANADGATVRGDINDALAALFSLSSGASAPATTIAHQLWADTTNNLLKKRNAANTGWIVRGTLDEAFVAARSANTIMGISDVGKTFICTSTFTQTFTAAATLGDNWFAAFRNNGAGVITLDPNASETIDGATTITLNPGDSCVVYCNGTSFFTVGRQATNLLTTEFNLASSGTTNLGSATSNNVRVTGTTTITSFGSSASTGNPLYFVLFAAALTLTHNATSLILPGAANIVTVAGDWGIFKYEGSGNWRCVSFNRSAGNHLKAFTGDSGAGGVMGLVPAPAAGDGAAGKVLKATGLWGTASGQWQKQVFTASGTFTTPATSTTATVYKVTVVGGGGGAGNNSSDSAGGGGGAGGVTIEWITGIAPSTGIAVTIGAGGVGGASATNGGTSSFGAYCSATGGTKGSNAGGGVGGPGGIGGAGTGGDLNLTGGKGGDGDSTDSTDSATCTSYGGQNMFGGATTGNAAANTGAGGGSIGNMGAVPIDGNGAAGLVMVEWVG